MAVAIPLAAVILGASGFGLTFITFRQNSDSIRQKANLDWVQGLQSRIVFLESQERRLIDEVADLKDKVKKCEESKTLLIEKAESDRKAMEERVEWMRRELNLPPIPRGIGEVEEGPTAHE